MYLLVLLTDRSRENELDLHEATKLHQETEYEGGIRAWQKLFETQLITQKELSTCENRPRIGF